MKKPEKQTPQTVNRQDLELCVYHALGKTVPHQLARQLADAVLDNIMDGLVHDKLVKLSKFGRFKVLQKGRRAGRNPKNGKDYVIEPRKSVSFYPSKALREAVNARHKKVSDRLAV